MNSLRDCISRWRHDRRRTKERLPQLRMADVVVVSHPGSGRHLLRLMMSRVWQLTHEVPQHELIDCDNYSCLDPKVPSIFFTYELDEPPSVRRQLAAVAASRRLLVLVRDMHRPSSTADIPLAAGPSQQRAGACMASSSIGTMEPSWLTASPDCPEFNADITELDGAAAFGRRWEQIASGRSDALVVRLEKLRRDPVGELGRVMSFLGKEASDAVLKAAVAGTSEVGVLEKGARKLSVDREPAMAPSEGSRSDGGVRVRLAPGYGYGSGVQAA